MSNFVAYVAIVVLTVLSIVLAVVVSASGLFPPIEQLGFWWIVLCATGLLIYMTRQKLWRGA